MEVQFNALIKQVKSKALVSGDKGYEVLLQGESPYMGLLVNAPADRQIICKITLPEITQDKITQQIE